MEVVIQIALMFFFIQFLVVMTIMSVALLLERPDAPILGRTLGHAALSRSFAFVSNLPSRVQGSVVRLAHSMRYRRSIR